MRQQLLSITKKELSNYFGSPLAIIFMGTFLAAVLFVFFSVEAFWVRGVADVRPLFRWMPVLLIFLLAALTMRQWSEEQRSGTQELLLTLPVDPLTLVLGKFLAVMTMIVVALALTLPLPITVALVGNIDWGPVIGGYVAALLMASAYAAIGLFMSSRTNSQIVALITTALVGGAFYLIGTRGVTDFVGGSVSEILWSLGTGSRFESIQRGVIDVRDLVYYGSLTTFFLMLNTISLDSIRWSERQSSYRRKLLLTAGLITVNLLILNAWLFPLRGARADLTENNDYSLSDTTKDLFNSLQEPLLIRAYVSEKTHPLLAPLTPQIRDMLREYEVASGGRISAELIDPVSDPEIEAEANQTYGIQPVPFQTAGRYEASVISAYFDILVRYGDQNIVIGFGDLIEVQPRTNQQLDVSLRNLEYDLTSAIKKVVFGFQSVDSVLAALEQPANLTLFVTSQSMPEEYAELEPNVTAIVGEIADNSAGKLVYQVVDLDDPNSPVPPSYLADTYGLQPIPTSFFSSEGFYAHMILENNGELQLIYPPAEPTEGEIRNSIESALKSSSPGFLKVVGVVTPSAQPDPVTGQQNIFTSYNNIQEQLRQEYTVQAVDLSTGQVPPDVDVLLVVAPVGLTDTQVFAIDQYLMRGGAVSILTGAFQLFPDQFSGGLTLQPATNPILTEWLAHHGVTIEPAVVMDAQNEQFPIPVLRNVGGVQVQTIVGNDYPFFVDVRSDQMNEESAILGGLSQVTLNWASPVRVAESESETRTSQVLFNSSDASWLKPDGNIQPDFVDETTGEFGFVPGAELGSHPLAVSMQGEFDSFYATAETLPITDTLGLIDRSVGSSRLVVIGSGAFVEDQILSLSTSLGNDLSLNKLQLVQNVVDWSVEDVDLLEIRARGTATRVLDPLEVSQQQMYEFGNYGFALVALIALYVAWRVRSGNEEPLFAVDEPIVEGGAE